MTKESLENETATKAQVYALGLAIKELSVGLDIERQNFIGQQKHLIEEEIAEQQKVANQLITEQNNAVREEVSENHRAVNQVILEQNSSIRKEIAENHKSVRKAIIVASIFSSIASVAVALGIVYLMFGGK